MWEQIRSNKIRSVVVITLMGSLLALTGIAAGVAFGGSLDAGFVGGGIGLVLWFFMWLATVQSGDKVMLRIAGAREIERKDHPQLWNIVEEMTIASRLPKMPRVFIVDDPSPNAFATGRDPKWAGVSVTTGLLRILDRDELQGVVAHEIGHIKNRDVALMTTAGVMMGCIVILAERALRLLWYTGGTRRSRTSGSDSKGGAEAVAMVIALILLIIAPLLAQMIYFALSRKREYLADASGAMFTRYPEGLARALEKLGGSSVALADESRVTAPMYIVRPKARSASGGRKASLFSTHPPIQERVRILREMGGGAGLAAYESAYRKVHGGSVVGDRSLASAEAIGVREASAAVDTTSERARARTASNAFISASGYIRKECGSCGAVLKIPPSVADRMTKCLRCDAQLP